jgi:hypothetical protein
MNKEFFKESKNCSIYHLVIEGLGGQYIDDIVRGLLLSLIWIL